MHRRLLMLVFLVAPPAVAQEVQRHEVAVKDHVFRCRTDGKVLTDCSVQPPEGGSMWAFLRLFETPPLITGDLNFETRYTIELADLKASVRKDVEAAMLEKARPDDSTIESDSDDAQKQREAAAAVELKGIQNALAEARRDNRRLKVRIEELQRQLRERGDPQGEHWLWRLQRALLNIPIAFFLGVIAGGVAVGLLFRLRKETALQMEEKRDDAENAPPPTPPVVTVAPKNVFDSNDALESRIDYAKVAEEAANKAAFVAVTRLVEQLTPKLEEIRSTAELRLDQIHETLKKSAPQGTDDSLPPTTSVLPPSARGVTPAKSSALSNWVPHGRSFGGPQAILNAWQSVEQRDAITPMDQTTYLSELIAELDLRETDVTREGPLFRIRRQDAAITSLIVLDDGAFCGILATADPEWYLLFARSQLCRRGDDYRVKFAKLFAWPGGWDGERPIRVVKPARGRRDAIDGRAQMARLSVTAVEDFEIVPGTVEVT